MINADFHILGGTNGKIEYYSHIQENAIDKNMILEYYSIEFLVEAQLELFLQASMRA